MELEEYKEYNRGALYEVSRKLSLDALTLERLKELMTLARVANKGYVICVCNTPKLREDIIFALTEGLKPEGIGVYQIRLGAEDQSLGRRIRILLESGELSEYMKNNRKIILSIVGLDEAIHDYEKKFEKRPIIFEKRPIILQSINLQRDYLLSLPFTLLIWVPEWLVARLPGLAPDFWAARSVVFEFLTHSEE